MSFYKPCNPGLLKQVCSVWRGMHSLCIERSPTYGHIHDGDIAFFKSVLGDVGVVTDVEQLKTYNRDWMGKYCGHSKVALRPKSTQQVSELLSYCSVRRLAVVPQGGNTGLVGGSVPVFDEVVLSTSSMNNILEFDEVSGVLVAQAGCVLQALDEFVGSRNYLVPLDLGAKGSCQIGGNVSTNAGGLRLLRYGSLRGSVLGLEVVLPDGSVLDLLKTLRKDNTGYDLKQLFIGAEGTLGVVTAVAIQCAPRPLSTMLSFLACPSFDAVQQVLLLARRRLGEILSAVEFLDADCMHIVTEYLPGISNPLPASSGSPFFMLIETHGSNGSHDQEKMDRFLEEAMGAGLVTDGTLAQSASQAAAIWRVREGITEALVKRGAVFKYDVSLPVRVLYQLVSDVRTRLAGHESVRVLGYGHVGDGNLHLNISAPRDGAPSLLPLVEPYVYEWTTQKRGSISAEHGLGLMKAECLPFSKPKDAIAYMAQIKNLVDPFGVMNPYKLLPTAAQLRQGQQQE